MTHDDPDQDERRHKLEAAQAQLARHERLARIALLLVLLLSVILLALVVTHLWGHQSLLKSVRGLIPHTAFYEF
jgi:hypothetical protein